MRILVVADTHDIVPTEVLDMASEADLVVHAGDFTTTGAYEKFQGLDLRAVHGNADEPELVERLPKNLVFEEMDHRFGVIHKPGLTIDDTTPAYYMAREMNVDVLLYGHSHAPLMEKSEVLLVCPGSPTRPRMSDPTIALLEVDEGGVHVEFKEVRGSPCGFVGISRELEK